MWNRRSKLWLLKPRLGIGGRSASGRLRGRACMYVPPRALEPLLPRPRGLAATAGFAAALALRALVARSAGGDFVNHAHGNVQYVSRQLQMPSSAIAVSSASALHTASCLSGHQFARALFQLSRRGCFDLLAVLQLAEGGDRGLDQVLRAGRAVGLGQDVGDAGEFQARADALAGGDAGARTGRDEDRRCWRRWCP